MTVRLLLPMIFVLLTLQACRAHKDYLTNVQIEGAVTLSDSTSLPGDVSVRLIDVNLDEAKSRRGYAFASFGVPIRENFSRSASYFWGSSSQSYATARIAVAVDKKGCRPFRKEYTLGDLQRKGRILKIDLGTVLLACD